MLVIKKKHEPRSLTEFRKKVGAAYSNADFPKDDVRDSLLEEQGGLCAYCMSRISKDSMKIEHWIPQKNEYYADTHSQSDCDKLAIEYGNMLGVCPGKGFGTGHDHDTCDTHRGNKRIKVTPLDEYIVGTIRYDHKGFIASSDDSIQIDIQETLNLNEESLVANRKSAWDACVASMLRNQERGKWSTVLIDKQIRHYEGTNANGYRYPYSGIVLYLLKKMRKSKQGQP